MGKFRISTRLTKIRKLQRLQKINVNRLKCNCKTWDTSTWRKDSNLNPVTLHTKQVRELRSTVKIFIVHIKITKLSQVFRSSTHGLLRFTFSTLYIYLGLHPGITAILKSSSHSVDKSPGCLVLVRKTIGTTETCQQTLTSLLISCRSDSMRRSRRSRRRVRTPSGRSRCNRLYSLLHWANYRKFHNQSLYHEYND